MVLQPIINGQPSLNIGSVYKLLVWDQESYSFHINEWEDFTTELKTGAILTLVDIKEILKTVWILKFIVDHRILYYKVSAGHRIYTCNFEEIA